jgi:hypothetical protein
MKQITLGLSYHEIKQQFQGQEQIIHITQYNPTINSNLTLLISKVSEAILPNTFNNHIGEGDNIDNYLTKQKAVRFIINGGFSHYRKNFYEWEHQNFNVGDPVGLIKIREHFFEDYLNLEHYGFLVQKTKGDLWHILPKEDLTTNEKYILGCTPLLIYNGKSLTIPTEVMTPVAIGTINPPSVLGHGLQNHPRTAIGVKDNILYFITVEGDNTEHSGCTLLDLQQLGMELKLDSLLNLDGGGSSQFRLMTDQFTIQNNIAPEDKNRVLGHVLVIFDDSLKL